MFDQRNHSSLPQRLPQNTTLHLIILYAKRLPDRLLDARLGLLRHALPTRPRSPAISHPLADESLLEPQHQPRAAHHRAAYIHPPHTACTTALASCCLCLGEPFEGCQPTANPSTVRVSSASAERRCIPPQGTNTAERHRIASQIDPDHKIKICSITHIETQSQYSLLRSRP